MPRPRVKARGASSSASPSPIENHPKPRAMECAVSGKTFVRLIMCTLAFIRDAERLSRSRLLCRGRSCTCRAPPPGLPGGHDKRRVDLSLLDPAQQVIGPTIDVGLSHANGQPFIHGRAKRDLVEHPPVYAWYRQRACGTANVHHLAHAMRPLGLQHHALLDLVVNGVDRAARMGLHADGVDALFRALAIGKVVE